MERILIFSGEGLFGSWELYVGKQTDRAIKMKLTREKCNGDRWAFAYKKLSDEIYQNLYNPNDIREVPDKFIRGLENGKGTIYTKN